MLLIKFAYQLLSILRISSLINKHFYREKIYGKHFYYDSVIMEFADGGDLYQKITQYKKKKKYFEEE